MQVDLEVQVQHLPGEGGTEKGKRLAAAGGRLQQRVLAALQARHDLGHHRHLGQRCSKPVFHFRLQLTCEG